MPLSDLIGWEAIQNVLEKPTGLFAIAVAMLLTYYMFPTSNDANNNNNTLLQGPTLTYSPYHPTATWLSDFKVLRAMWFSKITGTNLQERLDNFYQTQADLYDAYRVRMLHGRPAMLQTVTRHLKQPTANTKTNKGQRKLVWVDLACGTGYNIESFKTCLDQFEAIYLLDLCKPLCHQAQKRADKYNQQLGKKIIHVIHGDATDMECKELPPSGTVDLVTISYSLVMIPDWNAALANAKRLLQKTQQPNGSSGIVAVCDFTVAPDQTTVMANFWKRTFASDHVYLDTEHLRTLYREFNVVEVAGAYGPLPYTPIFLQPAYYYFVGTAAEDSNVTKTNTTTSAKEI